MDVVEDLDHVFTLNNTEDERNNDSDEKTPINLNRIPILPTDMWEYGAIANDSTIGIGYPSITPRVVVLLLHMWVLGGRCVFLALHVFLVHFLGVGVFFVMCGGRWWVVKCFFCYVRRVAKQPEVPKALQGLYLRK